MEEANINVNIKPEFLQLLQNSRTNKSINEKIDLSIAIFLFTERAITLARAAQLAGMGVEDFVNILISHNIAWAEYTEELKNEDNKTIQYILEEENKNA